MRTTKWVALALASCSLSALAGAAQAQELPASDSPATDAQDNTGIIVLGSRIPRTQAEGPAPVTVITSDEILRNGYQSVPDVLRGITQNGGETQSQQSFAGADFTPGAQQVDLRGLGPNHTLVLVNGRRIADFPLPYNGNSNFTDISNIPVGLIDRVEILSGSASAVYGSDAISGVVNFQMKSKPDGTRIDLRYGNTQHGGGESYRLTVTSGFESGAFHAVFGAELQNQRPLWDYQRKRQDSSADNPTTDTVIARRNFLRTDEDNDYLDPGAATCAPLAKLNGGTTYYATRPEYGYDIDNDEYIDGHYCGSNEAIAYGTMISSRKSASFYGSAGYDFSDSAKFFVDAQFSYSKLKLFRDVLDWFYVAPDGNEEGTFFNPNYVGVNDTYSGAQLDNWYRLFTPEEMGGLDKGMTRNRSVTYNITPGLRGDFGGKWSYELAFNHAEYSSKVEFPEVIIDKSNALFLGQDLGIDPSSGYHSFDANPTRLYTPLTPDQYASITALSKYLPKSWTNNVSATINTTELFQLPAGPVGFAAVAELGNQGYNLHPDPLALTQYYVGLIDSDGKGTRQHWGVGGELRVPVSKVLELSGAGRYDRYSFAGFDFGKFTYNLGVELRPSRTLLVRSTYGTGFRAPDLHYVFRGPGNTHTGGTDYFNCRSDDPANTLNDCVDDWDVDFINHKAGNRRLLPETSTSLTAGAVWAPSRWFDVSADYFRVAMKNQVRDLDIESLLRDEADCRLGKTAAGTAVDASSPTCVDAVARVQRYTSGALAGEIQAVNVMPINIARETTDGIDVAAHFRTPRTGIGEFSASLSYTYVFSHTIQQYPGDPVIDKLAFDSDYDIPRDKGTASITWSLDGFSTTLTGQRLGKLPNYDEDRYIKASYLFNLSAQYDVTERLRVSGTITNLFDQAPIKDPTYGGYPYYDISWFDGVGRSFYLQLTYKMGGSKL
ncbi:MAG: TonB-dependent receptor [Novosphingobium sp.]|nr:TonB-dependent receptor [Novosphingobium sp.]